MCAVPHSPALGFRAAPCAVLAPGTSTTLAARHTKSTSDLGQRRNRYDPTRLALGPQNAGLGVSGGVSGPPPHTRGASPLTKTRPTSPRTETHASAPATAAASRPYTPDAPWPPTSSRGGRATPPPQRRQGRNSATLSATSQGKSTKTHAATAVVGAVTSSASMHSLQAGQAVQEGTQQLLGARPWVMHSARISPRLQSAGTTSFTATRSCSRQRSCSQGSQDIRSDMQGHLAQPTLDGILAARQKGSPRAQSTRRAPTHMHVESAVTAQSNGNRPGTAGASSVSTAVVPQDGHEVAHMAHVRDSLLQHIQSVQKEITRLQAEREQQAQRGAFGTSLSAACSPYLSSRGMLPAEVCSTSASEKSFRRAKEGHSAHVAARGPKRAGISGSTTSTVHDVDDGQPTAACYYNSAIKIQRFWRYWSARQSLANPQRIVASPSRSGGLKRVAAFHHAAARIQRAWRVSRWRRVFVDFSERELGWVGSLDWLQKHNQLYGTELADAEDERKWYHRRQGAPLDREVDPWGCVKLRDHLHKMWYGRSVEELEPTLVRELDCDRWLAEASSTKRCLGSQEVLLVYEQPKSVSTSYRQGQPTMSLYNDVHAHSTIGLAAASSGRTQATIAGVNGSSGVTSTAGTSTGAAPPGSSGPGRSLGLAAPVGHKAMSLSPRREVSWARDGRSARAMPLTALPAASLQSPPPTHRTARGPTGGAACAAFRARSPTQAQQRGMPGAAASWAGRLSLPASGANARAHPQRHTSLVPGSPQSLTSTRLPHTAAPISCKG